MNFNLNKIKSGIDKNLLEICLRDVVDSTNDFCKRQKNNKKFFLCISENQTHGKGRSGKSWSSPSLGNIYMSLSYIDNKNNSPLSLVTGSVVYYVLKKITNSNDLGLKWPNDIILDNKKIGGILVEKEISKKSIKNIIGIGINFKLDEKENWWDDLSRFKFLDRDEVINSIIKILIDYIQHEKFDWKKIWMQGCVHLNKEIKIEYSDKSIHKGQFIDINSDGSMNIKINSEIKRFDFGEISISGVY